MNLIPAIPDPWPEGSTDPRPLIRTSLFRIAFLARGGVLSRTETDEPASPEEGDAYILPSGFNGPAWDTFAQDDVAVWLLGAWFVIPPAEVFNVAFRVADSGDWIAWDGAGWVVVSGGGGGSADTVEPVDVPGSTRDLEAADRGKKLRFTGSAPTLLVQDEAEESYPQGSVYHVAHYGSGVLTIAEDTAVTINIPAGGTLEVPPGGTVTLHRVAEDEWDLFGLTVEAP